jgi:hypothetical protein
MIPRFLNLSDQERNVYHVTSSFLKGRLEEQATIDWALGLRPNDTIKRFALLDLLDGLDGKRIGEPWRSAWRLIEESWSKPPIDEYNPKEYFIKKRLHSGERSGAIIAQIVELVEPRLKVEPLPAYHRENKNPRKKPKLVGELLSTGLTSRKMFDPAILGLDGITEAHFLKFLASALDFAVTNGLDIARRIGWNGKSDFGRLGSLYRIYFVPPPYLHGGYEPDEFHRGIAPSTKLLNSVLSRLVEVDISCAQEFARRWKLSGSPVYIRLWSSLSRDPRITPADEVGSFLLSSTDKLFWGINDYPEIAELRAVRFSELAPHTQTALTARIRKKPPREHWPKKVIASEVKLAQVYWAVRELLRIEVAGACLPKRDKAWLDEKKPEFPDLKNIRRVDYGFLGMPRGQWRQQTPDIKYYALKGEERLEALEADLSSKDARPIDVLLGQHRTGLKTAIRPIYSQTSNLYLMAVVPSQRSGNTSAGHTLPRAEMTQTITCRQSALVSWPSSPGYRRRPSGRLSKEFQPGSQHGRNRLWTFLVVWMSGSRFGPLPSRSQIKGRAARNKRNSRQPLDLNQISR